MEEKRIILVLYKSVIITHIDGGSEVKVLEYNALVCEIWLETLFNYRSILLYKNYTPDIINY